MFAARCLRAARPLARPAVAVRRMGGHDVPWPAKSQLIQKIEETPPNVAVAAGTGALMAAGTVVYFVYVALTHSASRAQGGGRARARDAGDRPAPPAPLPPRLLPVSKRVCNAPAPPSSRRRPDSPGTISNPLWAEANLEYRKFQNMDPINGASKKPY